MASAYNKFTDFANQLGLAAHNLSTDTFKIALSNSAPFSANTVLADITQISNGGGYTGGAGGGYAVTVAWSGGKWTITDKVITASGAAINTWRYAVLYNDTSSSDKLVGWYDYGLAANIADGASFTFDFDGTNGVFSIA